VLDEVLAALHHEALRVHEEALPARDVLRDAGVAGFTPAAVAKKAGLARSSMYQYYPSTDALLGAAITTMLERSRDRMVAAVNSADTPTERVTAYIRAAIADARDGHGVTPDIAGVAMPDVCREGVRVLHAELLEPLRSALVDAGVPDPMTVAQLVQGLVNAAVSAVAHGASMDRVGPATIDLVLRGVGLLTPAGSR
jgi:AcrR family transcriptional regulator